MQHLWGPPQRCQECWCPIIANYCSPFFLLPSDSCRKLLLLHQVHLTWHPRPTLSFLIWLLLIFTHSTWFLLFKCYVALFLCFQLLIVFNYVPFTVFVNAYSKWSDSLFCNYNLTSSFSAVFKIVLIPNVFLCNFFFPVTYEPSSWLKSKVNFAPNVKTWVDLGHPHCSRREHQVVLISPCVQWCMFAHECPHVHPHKHTPIKIVIKIRRLSFYYPMLWLTQTQSWWG